jgi:hypothetical protein
MSVISLARSFHIYITGVYCTFFFLGSCQKNTTSVTVPFILDNNRMLIDAEIRKSNSSWRKVKLWVDSGNPVFSINEPLAHDLGIDISMAEDTSFKSPGLDIPAPSIIRIGGKKISLKGVKSRLIFQPYWLFSAMHTDANLPSTVLIKYNIVINYPKNELTIADPGSVKFSGTPHTVNIQHETGIIQFYTTIDRDSLSFALDIGASYSYISEDKLLIYHGLHPEWPHITGTAGYANMWGWWPANEQFFPVVRIPEIRLGKTILDSVGIVGVPGFSSTGPTLGEWYSRKTSRPVDGFLGPNAFKSFKVGIDYVNSLVFLEKVAESGRKEMDLVGLSVRQLSDGTYQVVGIVKKDGKSMIEAIEPGDIIISIDDFQCKGATMGSVIDALRGKVEEIKMLKLNRSGKEILVSAKVEHLL